MKSVRFNCSIVFIVCLFFMNAPSGHSAGAAIGRLAILPFSGGQGDEGEAIAELLSFDGGLNEVFTPIPRTSITRAVDKEHDFQMRSMMTNWDTYAAIGKQLGAQYVMAGNITAVGKSKLLVIAILRIDTLQQVAGAVVTYTTIEEIRGELPRTAANIVASMRNNSGASEKLAVVPVQLQRGMDERVADTLAQILAIHLIRTGRYAVYPRTKSLEQVQDEYNNQLSGMTADGNIIGPGQGDNPHLVLSVAARSLGTITMFNASIIDLVDGTQEVGKSVDYSGIEDGINAMETLARDLTVYNYAIVKKNGTSTVIITKYIGSSTTANIPSHIRALPVTTIDSVAFANKQLTSVTIPSSVTTIGSYAFYGNQLTSVTIPNSVTTIGGYTFYGNLLTSVTIPNNVIIIGSWAFGGNRLTSVTIPNNVTIIDSWAFADNQLTSVTIPNSVTTIGYQAFARNRLISVTIPNSVATIHDYAFYDNQLTSVTIPNSVTTIGKEAFNNNRLTSVTIPNNVTIIGSWAFGGNRLTSITIPGNVTLESYSDMGAFGNIEDPTCFDNVYNNNGKRAGTYVLKRGKWSLK